MEVSTVNLQRGQFWIFNRVGFYGKGLVISSDPQLLGTKSWSSVMSKIL